ncbi:lyso-ornithine lipid acyltransferase [Loktanella atrilutea]|uniref:Lyso-ornithine lipid acyltransferase n=1 Tax=Loktanella atrilutea TaxID=366533 RepID=A0A1M4UNF6_LOKAT|nr:lysophospholipid acyltransferase family protein [Loktanella atrilutea]SHE58301.1 lyso-ornithine lipid acyltransferase [Loktanella atrilutea]
MTWAGDPAPAVPVIGPRTALRILRRAIPMALLVFGGLALLLILRLPERALHGQDRPWTPYLTRTVCRGALRLMGLPRRVQGTPMTGPGALVANHVSWLDIFVLNAGGCVVFVSKAEVAHWPGIGWLARATGTVFITRDRRNATRDIATLRDRLRRGQTLVFFPEGTSSDGLRVLPFKPTLFAPLIELELAVQPVTLSYAAPRGADPRTYGWWGDMAFGPHLLATLALPRQGHVTVTYHAVRHLTADTGRKPLAALLERQVRIAL